MFSLNQRLRQYNPRTSSTRYTISLIAFIFLVLPGQSAWGQAAGLLAGGAEKLAPITLSSGMPIADAPYELKSGKYYRLEIVCDGSAELAIGGADFFRNIWVDEVVINDIEVRPMGLSSLEFDDEGSAEIKFIAIRPGTYELRIPGTTGETQGVKITIK